MLEMELHYQSIMYTYIYIYTCILYDLIYMCMYVWYVFIHVCQSLAQTRLAISEEEGKTDMKCIFIFFKLLQILYIQIKIKIELLKSI